MISKSNKKSYFSKFALGSIGLAFIIFLGSVSAFANHPILVEGNCLIPPAGSSTGGVGVCGDYDGDGLIGTAEDNDGDRVFGTLNGAQTAMNGINNNGTITIVTSGVFAEATFTITGNVTLQAAPGVEALLDAVLQGDAGSGSRQGMPGIVVDAPSNRRVSLRNLTIKNRTTGINVIGSSRVTIENVRLENNINYGIQAAGTSIVSIINTSITATGYRLNPGTGDFPTTSAPAPGDGISFIDSASGGIVSSSITNNFRDGAVILGSGPVCLSQSSIIGNGRFSIGAVASATVFASDRGCNQN